MITCPGCGRQVSPRAAACPGCGEPIAARAVGTPVQTQQQTSQRLKGHLVVCWVVGLIGIGMVAIGLWQITSSQVAGAIMTGIGGLVALGAGVGSVVTRARIWWHHA